VPLDEFEIARVLRGFVGRRGHRGMRSARGADRANAVSKFLSLSDQLSTPEPREKFGPAARAGPGAAATRHDAAVVRGTHRPSHLERKFLVTNVEEVPGTNEGVWGEICAALTQMGPREFRQKSLFQVTSRRAPTRRPPE
jgi:hypothetical protein